MIDGSMTKAPVAKILIDSPYYEGEPEALIRTCPYMPMYDLILGNIKGAKDIGKQDPYFR